MSSQADVVAPQLAGDGAYGTSWRPPLLIAEGHGALSSKATAADECALALCAQAAGSSLAAQAADQRQLLDVEAPQESITLLFSKAVEGFGAGKSISVNVLPDDSVKEVRVRLKREGLLPSASQQCLFVGDRQLMDEDLIRDVLRRCPKSADVGLRHIFIRLADIERFDLQTATKGWSVQLEQQQSRSTEDLPTSKPVMSALAASLQRTGSEPALNGGRPMEEGAVTVRGHIIPERASITTYVSPTTLSSSNGLIHLVVRRGALVRQAVSEDNMFELTVHATDTTASIQQRLFLQEGWGEADKHQLVLHRGDGQQLPLLPGKSLAEYGVDSGQGALLELIPLLEPRDAFQFPDGSPLLSSPLHGLFPHFQEARKGLSRGQKPQLASAGSGGSYFLSGSNGHRVAVFKPFDEEPNAVNNPRGSPTRDESMRAGVMPGEGAIREVAAYVLDHDNFAGVPPTALVECVASDGRTTAAGSPSKVGSLQQFVASDFDCEEHGTSAFPVAEVHKIAVLDIRLANTDRNGGNILARRLRPPAGGWGAEGRESGGAREEWQLIPIDHGCCLPSCFEDITFEWMYWPQAQQPFSQDTLDYIAELDWQKDLRILEAHQLYLRPECRRVLCTSTMLLKKCAALGLTPGDVASIMCRETVHRSAMEKMHSCTLEILEREAEREQELPRGALVVQGAKAPEAAAAADLHAYLRVMADVMDDYLTTLVAVKAATEK